MASLTRIVVAADGRLKANFADNSVLLLNSSGSAFIHVSSEGTEVHQLSSFALQKYASKLAVALEFRNMHLDAPFVCQAVRPQYEHLTFSTHYPLSSVRWPDSVASAQTAGLLQHQPDGSWTLECEDTSVRLVLHPHHARFAVSYPLLLAHDANTNTYEYVWQTQLFSCSDYPERWRPAVLLVTDASRKAKQQAHELERRKRASPTGNPAPSAGQPAASSPDAADDSISGSRPAPVSSLGRASELPTALPLAPDTAKFAKPSWWYECTTSLLPSGEAVQLQWTPDAVYQYIASSQEVEVWLHADESCLVSSKQGRFFRHQRQDEAGERVYAADAVPQQVWLPDGAGRYPLAPITNQALMLREHCVAVAAEAHATPSSRILALPPSLLASDAAAQCSNKALSNEVKEVQKVEGCGTFTAYQDGRVRVVFADRTILSMDSGREACSLILPDGSQSQVAVSNPIGHDAYVQAAMQFAGWAATTPAERADALRQQAVVERQIETCQRAALLCDYAATKRVPLAVQSCTVQANGPLPASMREFDGDNLTLEPEQREAVVQAWLRRNAAMMARII